MKVLQVPAFRQGGYVDQDDNIVTGKETEELIDMRSARRPWNSLISMLSNICGIGCSVYDLQAVHTVLHPSNNRLATMNLAKMYQRTYRKVLEKSRLFMRRSSAARVYATGRRAWQPLHPF